MNLISKCHGLIMCFIGTINTIRVERGRKKSGRKREESTDRERDKVI